MPTSKVSMADSLPHAAVTEAKYFEVAEAEKRNAKSQILNNE